MESRVQSLRLPAVACVIALGALLAGCGSTPDEGKRSATSEAGAMSHFDLARKDCVGTARNTTSKVWFTVADGVLSDVYHPTVDITNVQTMQYIVTDGRTFTDLQTRDMNYTVSTDPTGMTCTITSTAKSGKYRLVTTYATDPDADAVVMRTKVKPLKAAARDLKVYVRFDATVNGNGGGGDPAKGQNAGADSAIVDKATGALVSFDTNTKTAALNATYIEPTYAALKADKPFTRAGSGLAETGSDGLTQLDKKHELGPMTKDARNGNVVQVAQVNTTGGSFQLALGFGRKQSQAASTAKESSSRDFDALTSAYRQGWQEYDDSLKQPPGTLPGVGGNEMSEIHKRYWLALNVIKASEDKTFPGAIAAGLASPWGQAVVAGVSQKANQGMNVQLANPGDLAPYFGSYRETFSRDLYQAASALLFAGDEETAQAAARFVLEKQQMQLKTGQIPRNSLPNGMQAPDTGGIQLDESSLPILLADQSGLGSDGDLYRNHIRRAADYVVSVGPAHGVERWEEQKGYSPSTIAAQIAGLVSAARIAETHGDGARSRHYLAVADHYQRNVKRWTVTTNGPVQEEPYFIRVSKTDDPNQAITYDLGNGGPTVSQRQVIDAGFLELTRLGALDADDRDVETSLRAATKAIDQKTPSGLGVHRYGTPEPGSEDGYGDCYPPAPTACNIMGKPWPGGTGKEVDSGTGGVWPALTGERGEHFIEAGQAEDAGAMVRAMSGLSGDGGLMPEQDWTQEPVPAAPYGSDTGTASVGFQPGKPSGSATPLTWSAGQFARLVLNLGAGRILERPAAVADRYVEPKPPARVPVKIASPSNWSTPSAAEIEVTGKTAPGAAVVALSTNLKSGDTTVAQTTANGKGEYSTRIAATADSRLTVTATTDGGTGYAFVHVGARPKAS